MPEKKFTKYFKCHLCDALNDFFEKEHLPLKAELEFKTYSPNFRERNMIDVAILRAEEQGNPSQMVGIEVEYISQQKQIIKNYEKFRDFIFQGNKGNGKRKGALLHLLFDPSNIRERTLIELHKKALLDTKKDYFFYLMYLHDIEDAREYKKLAEDLIKNDWKLRAKLFSLLEIIFRVKVKSTNY